MPSFRPARSVHATLRSAWAACELRLTYASKLLLELGFVVAVSDVEEEFRVLFLQVHGGRDSCSDA